MLGVGEKSSPIDKEAGSSRNRGTENLCVR